MKLDEFINKSEEQLEEGLKFFKESKKLSKYADKIENKLLTRKNKISSEDYSLLNSLLKEIKKASNDFKKLEEKFKVKDLDKQDAKIEHTKLSKKYNGLLKDIKSDKIKKLLLVLGISSTIVAGITGVIHPISLFKASDFAIKGGM